MIITDSVVRREAQPCAPGPQDTRHDIRLCGLKVFFARIGKYQRSPVWSGYMVLSSLQACTRRTLDSMLLMEITRGDVLYRIICAPQCGRLLRRDDLRLGRVRVFGRCGGHPASHAAAD